MPQPESYAIAPRLLEEVNLLLVRQISDAVDGEPIQTDQAWPLGVIAGGIVARLKPQTELEGMLAAQMVALHFAAMDDFAKAKQCPADDIKDRFLADAIEKCRTFAMTVGALAEARSLRGEPACL
ncbi:hypothetical protein [Labrys sp. ZIDIC5]|uniref:hypothetical protein n=1 Tax=Labrys sedimenti TaxID=3106036 RepID=UPI002ACA1537|nr:hypothetical protein [Labrys sp. ZIDIC5]MDZ5448618.1 hypothetical protein [Labrys sp. ZIDIC5]